MTKKLKLSIFTALVSVLLVCVSAFAILYARASFTYADSSVCQGIDGTYIRIPKSDEGEDYYGIQFRGFITAEQFEQNKASGENVIYGIEIVPEDLKDDATQIKDSNTLEDQTLRLTKSGDVYYFYASVINIRQNNITRPFTARTYYKIGNSKTYGDWCEGKAILTVVSQALAAEGAQFNSTVLTKLNDIVTYATDTDNPGYYYVDTFEVTETNGKRTNKLSTGDIITVNSVFSNGDNKLSVYPKLSAIKADGTNEEITGVLEQVEGTQNQYRVNLDTEKSFFIKQTLGNVSAVSNKILADSEDLGVSTYKIGSSNGLVIDVSGVNDIQRVYLNGTSVPINLYSDYLLIDATDIYSLSNESYNTVDVITSNGAYSYELKFGVMDSYSNAQSNDNFTYVSYGYNSPVTDYKTTENYEDYLNAGLNTLLPNEDDSYGNNTSENKQKLDTYFQRATDAGISKVIVFDSYIMYDFAMYDITERETPFIGTLTEKNVYMIKAYAEKGYINKNFNVGDEFTYDDFVTIIKNRLKEYIYYDNFYGVRLTDEPKFNMLDSTAITYKALKDAFPLAKQELISEGKTVKADDIFVHVNLWAYSYSIKDAIGYTGNLTDNEEIYRLYLQTYIKQSEASEICFDSYPMNERLNNNNVYEEFVPGSHFRGVQIVSDIAKQYGISVGGVVASSKILQAGTNELWVKEHDAEDMYYQLNAYMMFGFDSIGFYNYWSKIGVDNFPDYTSFINADGSKSDLYSIYSKINKEMLSLGNVLTNYEYNIVKTYTPASTLPLANVVSSDANFSSLASVTRASTKDKLLVTELKQKNGGTNNLYAIMNTNEPVHGEANNGKSATFTLKFNGDFDSVQIYFFGNSGSAAGSTLQSGKCSVQMLTNGEISINISSGATVYVVPMVLNNGLLLQEQEGITGDLWSNVGGGLF